MDMVKQACAKIQAGNTRGTGYLVAPEWMVTCQHVIAQVGLQGKVTMSFESGGTGEGTVTDLDPEMDWAIIKLAAPVPGTAPLRISKGCKRGDAWDAWGFPAIAESAGIWVKGEVQDADTKDNKGIKAIALYSPQVAAGGGAVMVGFSGTPVLVNQEVVGHMKRVIVEDNPMAMPGTGPRAEFGLTYAVPIGIFLPKLPAIQSEPPPPLQAPRCNYDPAWYILRGDVEKRAVDYLGQPGRPVIVWGSELSGKTWLMHHLLLPISKEEGNRVVRVNLDLLDSEAWESLDKLLYYLAWQIVEELGLDEGSVDAAWKVPGAKNRMRRFMAKTALTAVNGRLVLAVDQADTILRRSKDNCGDEFFGMLRGWASDSTEPWTRLRLVLSVSASPANLTNDIHQSPFNNLSDPIKLGPLTADQIQKLSELHGLSWSAEELAKVGDLLGGHPYLLRRLMFEAAKSKTPLGQLLDPKDPKGRLFDDYIENYRRHLGQSEEALRKLKTKTPLGPADRGPVQTLERVGLVTKDDSGNYRITCRLFERLLEA